MTDAALALGARIVLALVLASFAFAKLQSRAAVREQVATLVSERAAPVVAPLLPATELLVGVERIRESWWFNASAAPVGSRSLAALMPLRTEK